jgi:hypothetical protein
MIAGTIMSGRDFLDTNILLMPLVTLRLQSTESLRLW